MCYVLLVEHLDTLIILLKHPKKESRKSLGNADHRPSDAIPEAAAR